MKQSNNNSKSYEAVVWNRSLKTAVIMAVVSIPIWVSLIIAPYLNLQARDSIHEYLMMLSYNMELNSYAIQSVFGFHTLAVTIAAAMITIFGLVSSLLEQSVKEGSKHQEVGEGILIATLYIFIVMAVFGFMFYAI